MNEELKIIIRAVTEDAQKNMAKVRKELEAIDNKADDTGKSVGESMAAVAKGAAVAVGAIVALTAAMVALGKSAQDVKKGFDKLNTTFQNAGSTTAQASRTYKELFSFLGDHDKAIETAQSLALITSEEEKLAEWTKTLQGAFAEMGDKLPIEGLAEAANETINTGVVTGVLADALNWAKVSEDGFNEALAQTNSLEEREALVRGTLNSLYGNSAKLYELNNQATLKYNESQANLNLTLAQAAGYTTPLLTAFNELSTTLLTFLGPALQTVAMYMTAFIQLMAEAVQWVGSFFGMFSSGGDTATADLDGYRKAMTDYQNSLRKAFGGANSELDNNLDKINAVKKATMGFDELNIVSSGTSASTGSSGGGGAGISIPTAPNPADYGLGGSADFSQITKDIQEAKEKIQSLLPLIAAGAAAWAGWNLVKFIKELGEGSEEVKQLKNWAEQLGFEWKGFDKQVSNAQWKNGLKELGGILKGLVGKVMVIAGAIMVAVGFSDAWVNGLDWENFALILGGIAVTVGGLALAFGPFAAAIGLIVGGIVALVIGIKDLITNGYSMEAVIMVLVGAIAVAVGIMWAFNAALLANPITWIVIAIAALVAAFIILWNECEGFRQFWINLWDGIVKVFNAVVDWLGDACAAIGEFFVNSGKWIVEVWNGIPDFFAGVWKSIQNAFSAVGKWFSDIFTGAWNGIKKAFSAVGSFFTGIWNSIKNIFSKVGSAIGDAVSGAFKGAINWVLEKAIGIINGFLRAINLAISVINLIPGVELKKLTLLEVPKLAKGGITNGSTLANIGEAGREAVLPLENNTEWMNVLADRIASRNNAPSRIVLMLDGKELGWASINSINSITKQTGNLQLALG